MLHTHSWAGLKIRLPNMETELMPKAGLFRGKVSFPFKLTSIQTPLDITVTCFPSIPPFTASFIRERAEGACASPCGTRWACLAGAQLHGAGLGRGTINGRVTTTTPRLDQRIHGVERGCLVDTKPRLVSKFEQQTVELGPPGERQALRVSLCRCQAEGCRRPLRKE